MSESSPQVSVSPGLVLAAHDARLDRRVALKLIADPASSDPSISPESSVDNNQIGNADVFAVFVR